MLLGVMLALAARGFCSTSIPTMTHCAPDVRLVPARASARDWRVLPGVGWVLGGRLEAALHGRFWVDESMLDAVQGVGPNRLTTWRGLLVLGVQGR